MTTITITRNEEGKTVGAGPKAHRAYLRLIAAIRRLEAGETLRISYWFPRNSKFHRLHFKVLARIFEEQEQFTDEKALRYWLEVGAGHARFVPGPKGEIVAVPDSISYDSLDDEGMREHHEKVKDFLRSEYAQDFLWPGISPYDQAEKVNGILQEFERQ